MPGLTPIGALEGRLVDAHLRLGLHQVGLGLLEAGFGLRHVGDGELADPEALARGVELLDQHPHVVPARIDDADVAHQVGVGGDGLQQDRLLGVGQRARWAWMLAWAVLVSADRLAAAEDRLGDRQQRRPAVQDEVAVGGRHRERIGLDLVVLDRQRDLGPPVGDGLGQRFIGLAQDGALGQQVGIAVVGGRQRLDQALRPGTGDSAQPDRERAHNRGAGEPRGRAGYAWKLPSSAWTLSSREPPWVVPTTDPDRNSSRK